MQVVTRTKRTGRPQKLTEQQKDTIVNHYNNGDTQTSIAQEYGVSVSTVRAVLKERSKNEQ